MPRKGHQRPHAGNYFGYTEGWNWKYDKKTWEIVERIKAEYQQQLKDEEYRIASKKGIGFDTTKKPPKKPLILHYTPDEWDEKQEKKKQRDELKSWKNKQYHSIKYRLKKYKTIKEFKRKINEIANELKVKGIEDGREMDFIKIKEFMYGEDSFENWELRKRIERLQENLKLQMSRKSLIDAFNIILEKMQTFYKQNQ